MARDFGIAFEDKAVNTIPNKYSAGGIMIVFRQPFLYLNRFTKVVCLLLFVWLILATGSVVHSQEIAQTFKQNCSSCHWIGGGRLIGPDLKNVSQRQERDWLVRFIVDPKAMLDSGDPYAAKLFAEAKNVPMLQIPGMTAKLANDLLDFVEAESKLDSSQFAGKAVTLEPFSAEDAAKGLAIFSGRVKLKNNAPGCISCHTVNSIGGTLGGRLGPDLTQVLTRLQGRAAISAWLSAPPTATMKSQFQNKPLEEDEIKYLVAYFESSANNDAYNFDIFIVWMTVIFCGFGGSCFCLVLFSEFWSKRFRAVRRPLVNLSKIRGES